MFDANATGIDCWDFYFGEVHSTNKFLEANNIKAGDILLCLNTKVSGDEVTTKIWKSMESTPLTYNPSTTTFDTGLVAYSGLPNGKNFICDNWKDKAQAFLNGKWVEDNANLALKNVGDGVHNLKSVNS